MASVGESLLEEMNSQTPETVPDEPVVNETQETPEKPRRQRKPKQELADAPAETPAETVAEETTETAPAPEQPAWLKRVEGELGFQNVADESEVRDRLVDLALKQREELDRAKQEHQRQLQELQYRQTADATPAPKQEAERKPWQPPVEYPAAASRYLDGADENGTPKWKPDTPAQVRAQTEQFVAWRDDLREMMWNRPDQFFQLLTQFNEEQAQKVIEPFYEQRTAEQQQRSYFDSFAEQNAGWLYAKDPTTGQSSSQLSRIGQLFDQHVSAHLGRGCSPEDAVRYARLDVQEQTGQAPWAQQAAPSVESVREESRKRTLRKPLNGAGSVAPRTGSFTEPESDRPQNGNLRAGELLRQAMHEGAA